MRLLLLLSPLVFVSCTHFATERQILERSKAEVDLREPWSEKALVVVENRPAFPWSVWKVRAGQMDYGSYPIYRGLEVVPGTERELVFNQRGCLVQYDDRTLPCDRRYRPVEPAPAPAMAPASDK